MLERLFKLQALLFFGGFLLICALSFKRVTGAVMIDLPALGGSEKLRAENLKVYTVCSFEGD